jgi:hypothetical protein
MLGCCLLCVGTEKLIVEHYCPRIIVNNTICVVWRSLLLVWKSNYGEELILGRDMVRCGKKGIVKEADCGEEHGLFLGS